MNLLMNTYVSIVGKREIVEFTEDLYGRWIIYENNKPIYLVDCFDFSNEANLKFNYLLLNKQKSIHQIIKKINKYKNTNLSIKRFRFFGVKTKSKATELALKPFPVELLT